MSITWNKLIINIVLTKEPRSINELEHSNNSELLDLTDDSNVNLIFDYNYNQ